MQRGGWYFVEKWYRFAIERMLLYLKTWADENMNFVLLINSSCSTFRSFPFVKFRLPWEFFPSFPKGSIHHFSVSNLCVWKKQIYSPMKYHYFSLFTQICFFLKKKLCETWEKAEVWRKNSLKWLSFSR